MSEAERILDEDAIVRTVRRIGAAIIEATGGAGDVALVGIRRGGVPLARRIATAMAEETGATVPVGVVDITLYRDDAATALPQPKVGPSQIAFDVADRDIVLVDDVLQTGRTVRAAIDHLLDYGRPRRIWFAVLCDRGGRELPIAADFVGRQVDVPPGARLEVRFDDPPDRVELVASKGTPA